jgi:MFS family permease
MDKPRPFPRVVWIALLLEFLERAAYYGIYVNLAVYLDETVGLQDKQRGALMGTFAAVRSWVPIGTGVLADKIGFRRSLAISFALYAGAYLLLFAFPSKPGAWAAVMGMALGGAFLKPVVPATVRKHAPEERRALGFSYFYASVNAGSVVGKVATAIVRGVLSLRASMINAVVACVIGLGLTIGLFREPTAAPPSPFLEGGRAYRDPPEDKKASTEKPAGSTLSDLLGAFTEPRLMIFVVLISGYYLLIEQFYQTFPTYIVRSFGEKAPREYITLINPASIALLQVGVGRLTARIPAPYAISLGVFVGSLSMLLMGAVPTLAGACGAFFVFAVAEMINAPRYYEYFGSFAPKGREGMYMGLAIAPVGIGGLAGGVLSGNLIATYLPKDGPLRPLAVWGTYAAIGAVCAALLAIYATAMRARKPAPAIEAESKAA